MDRIEQVMRERNNQLALIDCQQVTRLEATFIENGQLYFLMELADRGDLNTLIGMNYGKQIDRKVSQFLLAELVLALEAMGNLDIAHRDLKPANILINKNFRLKVCDYGESKQIGMTEEELS